MDENGVVPACMQRDCQRHNQAHRQYPKHHPSPAQPWHGGCSPCQNKSTPLSTDQQLLRHSCVSEGVWLGRTTQELRASSRAGTTHI